MTPEAAIDLLKEVITFAVYLCAPFLIILLTVGLIISVLQSVTSIQEQTLSFVPKLLVFAAASIAMAPWAIRTTTEFATEMITRMGGVTS
ncbi:flagellar biosynthetic protein FliQ [Actomonas aquatica]|uniref:Flagellar biosynthetic protein FliQ n=1 Tax=Actomonas aquatica TaxID=2866162 RepID=A0ABZ1CCI1_9BACT|nr:flagellar biosynthetic protein FliQ [Opitutus sp. WL0086]WRQ89269.1 flagellar biosynthetic protein FliQ [Opitutus sp. WL0086]